jgi:hypothetical protein
MFFFTIKLFSIGDFVVLFPESYRLAPMLGIINYFIFKLSKAGNLIVPGQAEFG